MEDKCECYSCQFAWWVVAHFTKICSIPRLRSICLSGCGVRRDSCRNSRSGCDHERGHGGLMHDATVAPATIFAERVISNTCQISGAPAAANLKPSASHRHPLSPSTPVDDVDRFHIQTKIKIKTQLGCTRLHKPSRLMKTRCLWTTFML